MTRREFETIVEGVLEKPPKEFKDKLRKIDSVRTTMRIIISIMIWTASTVLTMLVFLTYAIVANHESLADIVVIYQTRMQFKYDYTREIDRS